MKTQYAVQSISISVFTALLLVCVVTIICSCSRPAGGQLPHFTGESDYGDVVESTQPSRWFTFVNPTSHAMKITSVVTTCGCTTTNNIAKGQIIEPHSFARFMVTINSSDHSGLIEQKIALEFEGDPLVYLLPVRANAIKELRVGIDSYMPIEVHKDEVQERIIPLRWRIPGRYAVVSAYSVTGVIKVHLETVREKEEYNIRYLVDTSHTKMAWNDTIILKTTFPELNERKIELHGRVLGTVATDPALFQLGVLHLDDQIHGEIKRDYTLTSTGKPFSIESIDVSLIPGLMATSDRISPTKWLLHLRLNTEAFLSSGRPKTTFARDIRVSTNLEGEGPVRIPVLAVFDIATSNASVERSVSINDDKQTVGLHRSDTQQERPVNSL